MKTINSLIALLTLTLLLIACENNSTLVATDESLQDVANQMIEDDYKVIVLGGLSDAEKEGLIFMREEEKLARDVYLYFYQKYGNNIFSSIATAESTHMASLKTLLDKYHVKDPVFFDDIGSFRNEMLAELFIQLTEAGNVSFVEAIKVGLTIEDLDIRDLMDYSIDLRNEDMITIYESLTKGSRNHMRSYYSQLVQNGGAYEPQFITQELFDYIINSPKE